MASLLEYAESFPVVGLRSRQFLCEFYVHTTVHRNKLLFNKTNRCTYFQIYFGNTTVHVSGSFPAHRQELSTVQSALVRFMQVLTTACLQD